MSRIVVRGARVLGGAAADIVVDDGRITTVGRAAGLAGDRVLDADGLIVLPGLVDLHTHLREPGADSETVATGSRAAAAGGYTAINAMANTSPAADIAERVEWLHDEGRRVGYVTVRPIGAVTRGLGGRELADIAGMARSRAAVRMFSDDGVAVADSGLIREALRQAALVGGVVAQHAQDPALTVGAQINDGPAAAATGLAGWPAMAEEDVIARDVTLARHTGARLHVCHVSTAGSVDVVRWAKAAGIRVTAEVTPHHLLLTDRLAATADPVYKVNPPLRTAEDVAALRAALGDGTIDAVATDHAPHDAARKTGDWIAAANGMVGLETALSVVHEAMVATGELDWDGVADRMSRRPAAIAGIAGYSGIVPGAPANLVVYDPGARRTLDATMLAGRSRNSPYLGMSLPGRIVATIHEGTPTVWDGGLVDIVTG
jgi:dihydroorotase